MKIIYDTTANKLAAEPLRQEYLQKKAQLETLKAEMEALAAAHHALADSPIKRVYLGVTLTHTIMMEGGTLYIKIDPTEKDGAYLYQFCNELKRARTAAELQEVGVKRVLIDDRFDREGHDIDEDQLQTLLDAPHPICYMTMKNGWIRHPNEVCF